jgi:hypothetical protein
VGSLCLGGDARGARHRCAHLGSGAWAKSGQEDFFARLALANWLAATETERDYRSEPGNEAAEHFSCALYVA